MSLLNIFLVSIAGVIGDFGFKGVAREGGINSWVAGVVGYIGVIYFLIRCLKTGNVIYVSGMWNGVSSIIGATASFIILGERLNTPAQYMGLALILGGTFCLNSGGISF